jgi:hypothetical protein
VLKPAIAAAIAALLTGCAVGTTWPAAPTPNIARDVPPSVGTGSPPTTTEASATEVAQQWMVAYRTRDWRDGSPSGWIDRVRPYVSDTEHARDEQLRTGTTGVDWDEFVDQHCRTSVANIQAVIPPESPGTTDAANVQVSATINTTCDLGGHPRTEPAAATLAVVRTPEGGYRVDRRLF